MRRNLLTLLVMLVMAAGTPALAGWFENVAERAAKRATERVVDRAARESSDAAYENTKEGIKKGGRNDAPEEEQSDSPRTKKTSSRDEESNESDSSESESSATGEVYNNKFDFIAGDKVIFFEDFSDTPAGDYPSRWTLGEGGGPVEVVEYQGKHWLKSLADGSGKKNMRAARSFMRVDLSKSLPEKFTVEFDIPATADIYICFPEKYWATGADSVGIHPEKVQMYWANVSNNDVNRPKNPLRHVSIAVSGTNVKVYFDAERVLLVPDGVRARTKTIRTIGFAFPEGKPRQDLMFTNFRLAEGGKDYAKDLVNGRIVTHGITFDTGSDVLKPQSGPTLWKIHKLLEGNADLKFEIQGHTDNTGSSSDNQTLSEDRASAVKNWLVAQGIDEGRLSTKGFGDSKPMSTNDTPEGRADNRRVEFVKK